MLAYLRNQRDDQPCLFACMPPLWFRSCCLEVQYAGVLPQGVVDRHVEVGRLVLAAGTTKEVSCKVDWTGLHHLFSCVG